MYMVLATPIPPPASAMPASDRNSVEEALWMARLAASASAGSVRRTDWWVSATGPVAVTGPMRAAISAACGGNLICS
ncbi:hypothetical protein QF030_000399 [Streptomyces rishiriensis]|uniref:Uncharacterized protein n=1 Tax=Streptomyces rishiriensis TaxID=68264 RepID=A0ABU0NGI7_STRRH|nr:hypothetical protein [Streptomyces rishiriensis]